MSKRSRKSLFGGLAVFIVIGLIWLISDSAKSREADTTADSSPNVNAAIQTPPVKTGTNDDVQPVGRAELTREMDTESKTYEQQIEQLKEFSQEDRFSRVSTILTGLIADISSFDKRMKASYQLCLEKSSEKSALSDCEFSDGEAQSSIMATLGGVDYLLSKLPNYSQQELIRENADWFSTLDKEQVAAEKTMTDLSNDPKMADKFRISISDLGAILNSAKADHQSAVEVQGSDPVASAILIDHADLLYADYTWRTLGYKLATFGGRPTKE